MGLFSESQVESINAIAKKSKAIQAPQTNKKISSINDELDSSSKLVEEYFKDSKAILITDKQQLHEYVTAAINCKYIGIDTETTGLDRSNDYIVGASLYYPTGIECYIPIKHRIPIFEDLYKNQLTYEDVAFEFQRFVDEKANLIFANANFDLYMIWKDLNVDLCPAFYYYVILAWRCLKEDELHNGLKELYNKYVLKGKGDPKRFSDFFSPALFPYCKPEIAKLYAANDAKITYDLFKWQLPFTIKTSTICKKNKLEHIADLIWNIEFPLVSICQDIERTGMYIDKDIAKMLQTKYHKLYEQELDELKDMVQNVINDNLNRFNHKSPFASGSEFNPRSPVHVKYLCYDLMQLPKPEGKESTGVNVLSEFNNPVTDKIVDVRSLATNISTFIDKLPDAVNDDGKIHADFWQIGASTGRLSSRNPNLMNIPSKLDDIRHMFRADPGYIMISSDFSQQEPKLTAYVSQDPNMIKAFKNNRDIYATIASIAFNKKYEECLEFNPDTGEYQPEGKSRRNSAKTIVLGITYGRSVPSIGQQLFGNRNDMSDEDKTKEAQKVYDSVMRAFPSLERLMLQSQAFAHKHGYVETILGRRRHLPDMLLNEFEFEPLSGYVNPTVDPLDLSTLNGQSGIPESYINMLNLEFSKYKYFGQVAKRTKQLYEEEHIKVINNRPKINDAKRQCVNCVDKETEILTLEGWKTYDKINAGDEILSYSLDKNELVKDKIKVIQINEEEDIEVNHLYTSTFDAVCTNEHRWVMRNFDTDKVRFYDTNHILKFHRPRYHILRIVENSINSLNSNDKMESEESWAKRFFDGNVSISEIFKYSFNEANIYYTYFKNNLAKNGCIQFKNENLADLFQILCIMCGKVGNKRKVVKEYKKKPNEEYWLVSCPKRELYQTARIDMMKKEKSVVNLAWCVTTTEGTWIARRNGKYYITGNSIIQGSAADFTKTALLNVCNDERWKNIGGQVLTVVHDEIVAQVPIEKWEEGANVLKEDMESAGAFLPFPIKCDVTASYRWYGLEVPCKFDKPSKLSSDLNISDIGWIQWHLIEMGYELPVFNDENGNKPIGDAAHGVSGKWSDAMDTAIETYCHRYNISEGMFLDDIEKRVSYGIVE